MHKIETCGHATCTSREETCTSRLPNHLRNGRSGSIGTQGSWALEEGKSDSFGDTAHLSRQAWRAVLRKYAGSLLALALAKPRRNA